MPTLFEVISLLHVYTTEQHALLIVLTVDLLESSSSSAGVLYSELPPRPTRYFGYSAELERIYDNLKPDLPGRKALVVHGPSGSGKTQLVRRYIELHHRDYSSVVWIDASEGEEGLLEAFHHLALQISQLPQASDRRQAAPITLPSTGSRLVLPYVKKWLSSCQNKAWLLVFDGVDDTNALSIQQLRGHIPECRHGSLIITTVHTTIHEALEMPSLELRGMHYTAGSELLLCRIGLKQPNEDGNHFLLS